jgi:hypothetical protein
MKPWGQKGRVAMGIGLRMDVPGDGPDLEVDGLQPSGLAPGVFEDGSVEGGGRFDGNTAVGS